uniref:Uncharacterized protein n=1 Tax=Opuntia streptacantha TaxID=393608 RepID=A0A7C8ZSW8_OPUST
MMTIRDPCCLLRLLCLCSHPLFSIQFSHLGLVSVFRHLACRAGRLDIWTLPVLVGFLLFHLSQLELLLQFHSSIRNHMWFHVLFPMLPILVLLKAVKNGENRA